MQVRRIFTIIMCLAVSCIIFTSNAQSIVSDSEKQKQWKSMENGPWDFAPDWYYFFLHKKYSGAEMYWKWDWFNSGFRVRFKEPKSDVKRIMPVRVTAEETQRQKIKKVESERKYIEELYKEELAREIFTTKNKLRDLDVSLRTAQLELTKLKKQAEDATVYASINGVVKTLQDVDNLPGDGSAFLVVTGSDGLYVKGQIGELLLDQVTPGTPVSLTSWQSNAMCDATITEIAEYPSDGGYYGSGNPNSSYYEFTAYIEDAGALTNGEAVDITIQGDQDVSTGAIYLQKAYVRKENGKYYVLKEDGDGRLKKQYVKTGKTVYGSAIEIRSGITADDYIAFPYGKTAKEGVRTKQADTTYYGMTERRSANV